MIARAAPIAAATLIAIAFATPARADEGEALVAAARAGDRARVEQAARRLGARKVASWIADRSRATRLAAIAAARFTDDPWVALPALVVAASDGDRSIAAPAARALADVTSRLDRAWLERMEVPPDEIRAAADGCAALAARAELAPDVRVHAIECRVSLLGDVALALLQDREPEVRRAAAAFVVEAQALTTVVHDDPDPAVAATAAASLCAAGASTPPRTAALALDPSVEPGVVIRLLPCVDDDTRELLRRRGARPVRDWLRRRK